MGLPPGELLGLPPNASRWDRQALLHAANPTLLFHHDSTTPHKWWGKRLSALPNSTRAICTLSYRNRPVYGSYVLLVVYDEEGRGRGVRASWGEERGRSPSGAPQLGRRGRGEEKVSRGSHLSCWQVINPTARRWNPDGECKSAGRSRQALRADRGDDQVWTGRIGRRQGPDAAAAGERDCGS